MGVTVEFERVVKRFGSRAVLARVSGALVPGAPLVVTGPNGSGKSTLLNVIAGVIRPSSGTVRYREDGHELPRSAWFSRLGVAAPDMAVYDELTALENLAFFARLRGLHQSEAELAELLAALGLAERDQRRPVAAYSSGMRQRVKLAQALVHDPPVLLLDEPSSNLDRAGHEVLARVVAERAPRVAVAIASNDPREIAWGENRVELGV